MLRFIDVNWIQHLTSMEQIRQGTGLYAFGQRDPLVMYKRESRNLFDTIIEKIGQGISHSIFNVSNIANSRDYKIQNKTPINSSSNTGSKVTNSRIGRNDPCPCGSGKKYKRCHGN